MITEATITLSLFLGIYEYVAMIRASYWDYLGCVNFLHLLKVISPYELLRDYRYDNDIKYRTFRIIVRLLCTFVGFFGLILCIVLHDIYYIYNNSPSYIGKLGCTNDEDDEENDPGYIHFVDSHKRMTNIHETEGNHYHTKSIKLENEESDSNDESNIDDLNIELSPQESNICEIDNISCHNTVERVTKLIKESFSSDIACILVDENIDHVPIVNAIQNIGISNIYIAKFEESKLRTVERTYDVNTHSVLYHVLHTNIDDALFTFWCTLHKDIVNLNNKLVSTVIISDGENPKPSQFAHIRVFNNPLDTEDDLNAKVLAKLIDSTSKFYMQ